MRKLAIKRSGRNGTVNTVFAPVLSVGEPHDRTIAVEDWYRHAFGVKTLRGNLTREQVIERYARSGQRDHEPTPNPSEEGNSKSADKSDSP